MHRFIGFWIELRINLFLASFWVDISDHVLQTDVVGEQVLTGRRVKRIKDAQLAARGHGLARPAVEYHRSNGPLECPIEIPDVALQVLVVPYKLSGFRPERKGCIGVKGIVPASRTI